MQPDPISTSEPAPPDPPSSKPRRDPTLASRPSCIGTVCNVVFRLLDFGRHLASTLKQRSEAPNFSGIAVSFGTARVTAISAHLQRGILRAIALENVLRARLATGYDLATIDPLAPRPPRKSAAASAAADPAAADAAPGADAAAGPAVDRFTAASADPAAAQAADGAGNTAADPSADAPSASNVPPAPATALAQAAALDAAAKAVRRRISRPPGWDDPELFMPTLKELEAEIRRRPIGRTIIAICLDLGIAPGYCTPEDWDKLFECIHLLGGSLNRLRLERNRRREAFMKESDRRPVRDIITPPFPWWNMGRGGERKVLGFLFGEVPVNPFASPSCGDAEQNAPHAERQAEPFDPYCSGGAAAIATGPP